MFSRSLSLLLGVLFFFAYAWSRLGRMGKESVGGLDFSLRYSR